MDEYFSIRVHFGGQMVKQGTRYDYEGGVEELLRNVDGDSFCVWELDSLLDSYGYKTWDGLWFRPPYEDTSKAMHPLKTDDDVRFFVGCIQGYKEVDVFVQHTVENVDGMTEKNGGGNDVHDGDDVEEINQTMNEKKNDVSTEYGAIFELNDALDDSCIVDMSDIMGKDLIINWDQLLCDSDDLHSVCDTSDEDDEGKYSVFRAPYDPTAIVFKVGMQFASMEFFRQVLADYAVHGYRDIHFVKHESKRSRVVCVEGCKWLIYVSTLSDGKTVQVKTYNDQHTCARGYENKNMSAKWLAKHMVSTLRSQPNLKTSDVQSYVVEKFGLGCSRNKAFRAKRMATDMIEGCYEAQYGMVRDYCEEVLRANPGSTCVVKCNHISTSVVSVHFERMYMCLAACKAGFIAGCMPVIGIDGCHLKGPCGGILLAAVAVDPNRQVFLLAVAAVEAETKDSWSWFLRMLVNDIGHNRKLTFISDQQKGLVPALAEVIPSADHRFCVRHLYSNFKKQHPGEQLREMMWACARATYPRAFEANMKKVKELNKSAWQWLNRLDPKMWSRSAFSFEVKNDIQSNNLSESFNALILGAREKPIITMMDAIRRSTMLRFQMNREIAMSWNGSICPEVLKKLEEQKKDVNEWIARYGGAGCYEIQGFYNQFSVNLVEKSCSCRKWELTGIPCVHAISAMWSSRVNPEQFVDDCHSVAAYKACYESVVYPINGKDMWPITGLPRPLPPQYRRRIGRPKKLRRRDPDEKAKDKVTGKLSRERSKMRCTKCKQYGHNKRSCKGSEPQKGVQPPPPIVVAGSEPFINTTLASVSEVFES